jgi:hypothetical protein
MTGPLISGASPEIVELVAAYQENRTLAASRRKGGYRIVAENRRKYILLDEIPTFEGRDLPGRGGRFMVDRETGRVFTIRGYGKRGHYVGTVTSLTAAYRQGSASYKARAGGHVETAWSKVARWRGGDSSC